MASTIRPVFLNKLKALFDALIFSSVYKNNHLRSDEMFYAKAGHSPYRSARTERGFTFLICCLRFDDMVTMRYVLAQTKDKL